LRRLGVETDIHHGGKITMKGLIVLFAMVLVAGAGEAQAEAKYKWKMTTIVPETSAFYQLFAPPLANWVKELTDGEVEITPYPAGVIAPSLRAHDAVIDGTAETVQAPPIYLVNRDPTNTFFGPLPGGMGPDALMHWYFTEGKDLLAAHRRETMGLHSLPCGLGGTELLGHAHKPIRVAEDLKGVKFRTAGAFAHILNEYFGASTTVVPGSEVYGMMERKAIDATEWSGPSENVIAGLHETARYIMYPGPQTNAWFMEFAMKKERWDDLPDRIKRKLEAACRLSSIDTIIAFDALDIEAWKKLKQGKNEIVRINDELITQIRNASREWALKRAAEEKAKGNPWMERVAESYFRFYDDWLNHADFRAVDIKAD
jgi:TRAP-type mannitol/chloroaromatic compound transport system substrate-binding protein